MRKISKENYKFSRSKKNFSALRNYFFSVQKRVKAKWGSVNKKVQKINQILIFSIIIQNKKKI